MNHWRLSRMLVLCGGMVLGAALLPALSGCKDVGRVIGDIWDDEPSLSAEAQQELNRFEGAFLARYPEDGTAEVAHFKNAFNRVRFEYVKEVDPVSLIDAALAHLKKEETEETTEDLSANEMMAETMDAMLASLDPHSSYLDPDELAELNVIMTGEFGGLGIEITLEEGLVRVVSPIEGTPAFRAGLLPGDLITHLDGTPVMGMTLMESMRIMRGRPGTDIVLTMRRQGVDPFDVTITRDIIEIQPVRSFLEGTVGYIRIASFSAKAEDGVLDAMDDLRAQSDGKLSAIVLDLSSNPGGMLDQSVAVADAFLNEGVVVAVKGRRKAGNSEFRAYDGDVADGLPMVVLINGGSASASEIVASALQEHGRATVMGRRSYGKGSVQTITRLPEEGALRLTTQLYYAPSGRTIQGLGVVPDITLAVNDDGVDLKREADLPGALSADLPAQRETRMTVQQDACPAVGEGKNPMLGCALLFLEAGSFESFLSKLIPSKERSQIGAQLN